MKKLVCGILVEYS